MRDAAHSEANFLATLSSTVRIPTGSRKLPQPCKYARSRRRRTPIRPKLAVFRGTKNREQSKPLGLSARQYPDNRLEEIRWSLQPQTAKCLSPVSKRWFAATSPRHSGSLQTRRSSRSSVLPEQLTTVEYRRRIFASNVGSDTETMAAFATGQYLKLADDGSNCSKSNQSARFSQNCIIPPGSRNDRSCYVSRQQRQLVLFPLAWALNLGVSPLVR